VIIMGQYADYIPGSPATAPEPAPLTAESFKPWVLWLERGSWSVREPEGGPVVHASDEPMGIIDATFWAGELIPLGSGKWVPVDEGGPIHVERAGKWVPKEGPVYRWQPTTPWADDEWGGFED
jgi:hypothetical protein